MAEVNGHVAFSAFVTTGTTVAASNDSSVPFYTILLNAGNAYNGYTGVFTCPQEGDYVFMLNANVGHYFDTLQIHKNGQVVATAGRFDPSATLLVAYVILTLQPGDTVYVVQRAEHNAIESNGSTFSGFRII
jgi:hypothetical protein